MRERAESPINPERQAVSTAVAELKRDTFRMAVENGPRTAGDMDHLAELTADVEAERAVLAALELMTDQEEH